MKPSRRAPAAAPATPPPPSGLTRLAWVLRVLGFFSGGAVMIVEFSGTRLLTPVFGNSLYTWTGLIGVILVALSCGDYIGGWLVDRFENALLLPALFSFGGALTAMIPLLAHLLPPAEKMDIVSGPIFSSLLLFFLPGLVLAAVTPVSIRLLSKAYGDHRIGTAAGTVGMSAALGSFVGTFATTYLLIPHFGVREIFFILGGLLIVVGIVLALLARGNATPPASLILVWLAGAGACAVGLRDTRQEPDVLFARDTFYHRISVLEEKGSNQTARVLKLDSTYEGAQSVETGDVLFEYQKYWTLAEVFRPDIQRATFIGAGAFGMPEQLSLRFPQAHVDVIEIDPEVVAVGKKYFNLDKFVNVQAHAEDGRRFLLGAKEPYDLIFGDAYNGVQYVPAHLVTKEFFALVKSRLKPGGVYMMNLIGALQGPGSEFFWNVHNSLRASLPHIMVLGTQPYNNAVSQNLIIIASDQPLDSRLAQWQPRADKFGRLQQALLRTRFDLPEKPEFAGLYTDNKNPVEYVIARQVRGG